jgi:predicted kinase
MYYLICGSTGAGKTTYAKALAKQVGGFHFAIDAWMTTLFWPDSPDPISFDWAMERINRCEAQIIDLAYQCYGHSIPVILDLGFTKKDHRQKFASIASGANIAFELHFVDVDRDERWARVQNRNHAKGPTFAMEVNRDMFDFVEAMWEAPDQDEMTALNGKRINSFWSADL